MGTSTYMEVMSLYFTTENAVNGLELGTPGNCLTLTVCSADGGFEVAYFEYK
jgi:hypothetical protein